MVEEEELLAQLARKIEMPRTKSVAIRLIEVIDIIGSFTFCGFHYRGTAIDKRKKFRPRWLSRPESSAPLGATAV
jgi:hypothetical protein